MALLPAVAVSLAFLAPPQPAFSPVGDPGFDSQAYYEAQVSAWQRRQRNLAIGVGISSAAVASGALAMVVGSYRAKKQCEVSFCEGTPFLIGIIVGAPLIIAGTASTLGFGIALGKHRNNHPQARLSLAPGALHLRF